MQRRTPWQVVALPSGAATAGLTYQLPGGEITRIGSLAFRVHTAAGGAARQVLASLVDETGARVFTVAAPGTQAAALDVDYSFAPLVSAFGTGALAAMGGPFPGGTLANNLSVAVTVVGAAAGDTITAGRLLVQQFEREPHATLAAA